MSEKIFDEFLKTLKFDISEYFVKELSDWQKKTIEDASFILKENICDEILSFGGSFKQNEEKFKKLVEAGEQELKNDKYKDTRKEIDKIWKEYIKKLREVIPKTCVAKIPVKEMPWEDIYFRTHPRLMVDKKKVSLAENTISFYGSIKCVISRTTLYGKMKGKEPLFAPYMGELNLMGFQLDESQKKAEKSQIFPYVSAIIDSLDSVDAKAQLAKYHEGYQRHGEPICDFLMKDNELMTGMMKLTSAMESKRLESDIAVCAIAVPHSSDKKTLILTTDESKDGERFGKCFEAVLRLSAACCEAPSTRKDFTQQAEQMTQAAKAQAGPSGPGVGGLVGAPALAQPVQPGGMVQAPGGQELKVWSEEELATAAQERGGGGVPPGMAVWSEEELEKAAQERGTGIPDGMEVWTEEDLEKLAKERQGGSLNIPEWKDDGSLIECANCGYGLRQGWTECPVCDTPVGAKAAPKAAPKEAPKVAPKEAPKAAPKEAPKSPPDS